jgi:hypothetical protein
VGMSLSRAAMMMTPAPVAHLAAAAREALEVVAVVDLEVAATAPEVAKE